MLALYGPHASGMQSVKTLTWYRDGGLESAAANEGAFRARRSGLLRSVAVVLGNTGNPAAVPPLIAAPEPLVRAHAAWALGRLEGVDARHALEAACRRDPDPTAAAEATAALLPT